MDNRLSSIVPTSRQAVQALQEEAAQLAAIQVESSEDVNQFFQTSLFNPLAQARGFRSLTQLQEKLVEKPEETQEEGALFDIKKVESASERFQKSNYELSATTLRILRGQLARGDTADDILAKVNAIYKDAALADEALEFLQETTDGQLLLATQEAKDKLNKDRGREVRAGKNMGKHAREFSEKGLGSPESLRDLYRDITLNPREPLKLFEELTERFPYLHLRAALQFILHSVGADLRSKGPSIERPELQRLLDETRSVQGILSLFRFFQSRMRLIQKEFGVSGIIFPTRLDFEQIGKAFAKLLAERFISPEKITASAHQLGISPDKMAQVIIFTQMRDAMRQIPPKYYRDNKHKDELLQAFIDTIDKLEDEMDEGEEKK